MADAVVPALAEAVIDRTGIESGVVAVQEAHSVVAVDELAVVPEEAHVAVAALDAVVAHADVVLVIERAHDPAAVALRNRWYAIQNFDHAFPRTMTKTKIAKAP